MAATSASLAEAGETKAQRDDRSEKIKGLSISTRLTERFGIQHPIIGAPMAFISGGALAAAVTRAGGLGFVGGGYAGTLGGEPDLDAELTLAKAGKFGVGFITWALARTPKTLGQALKHSPSYVFLSFGDPRPFAAQIRDAGAALICQVQFLSQIDMALEAGATAIVVQGTEAGGHGGTRSTLPFVPEAADYLMQQSRDTLLIAAGGIADGRGLAAALILGADAVVVGTRFWACSTRCSVAEGILNAVPQEQVGRGMGGSRHRSIPSLRFVISAIRRGSQAQRPGYGCRYLRRERWPAQRTSECRIHREVNGCTGLEPPAHGRGAEIQRVVLRVERRDVSVSFGPFDWQDW